MDFLSEYLPLTPFAINIGISCVVIQLTFTILFNKRTKLLPEGPWNHLTLLSAHQVVSFPLMIILAYYGIRDWYFNPNKESFSTSTPTDRIFGESNPNDIPLAIGSGAILLWDIPIGFVSPPLRDPVMYAHHIGSKS